MKKLIRLIGMLLGFGAQSESHARPTLESQAEEGRILCVVNAIWVVEGGSNTRYPYGIKSIKTRDKNHAKEICINTVRRTLKEWREHGKSIQPCFVTYLGNRYCPRESDRVGHTNWVRNMKLLVPEIMFR